MSEFHFIRPFWLLTILPFLPLATYLFWQRASATSWSKVCDEHLLPFLMKTKGQGRKNTALLLLCFSMTLMIVSLAGPTWSRLPVPTYRPILPRVIVLDMSRAMLETDLPPDRLSRAKFKLHDLFQHKDAGQFGLVVYTGEPFIVSPLTDDGQTIDALLSSLTPEVMPVEGQLLSSALNQAAVLIAEAGFQQGQLLVLTATPPSSDDISTAKSLSNAGMSISVVPMIRSEVPLDPLFHEFARAGHGEAIVFSDTSKDLDQWLRAKPANQQYTANSQNDIPVWRDQGRWFLIPALVLLLPVFRRGWLS
jgi:Ca-activated chloride channel family protein